MARPIPNNPAGGGGGGGRVIQAEAVVPAMGAVPQRPAPAIQPVGERPQVGRVGQEWAQVRPVLLVLSGLVGAIAIAVVLRLAPTWDLGSGESFYLVVAGVYLLATSLYAALRTGLMRNMDRAPADARLMAYTNVVVGGLVGIALGVVAMAAVALIAIVVLIIVLLLGGGDGERP